VYLAERVRRLAGDPNKERALADLPQKRGSKFAAEMIDVFKHGTPLARALQNTGTPAAVHVVQPNGDELVRDRERGLYGAFVDRLLGANGAKPFADYQELRREAAKYGLAFAEHVPPEKLELVHDFLFRIFQDAGSLESRGFAMRDRSYFDDDRRSLIEHAVFAASAGKQDVVDVAVSGIAIFARELNRAAEMTVLDVARFTAALGTPPK
jgi:hypothetical protein